MFNNPVKIEFTESYSNDLNVKNMVYDIFRKTESFERAWESDLCTKTSEELCPMLLAFLRNNTSRRELILSILKDYVQWCIDKGFPDACDGMLKFDDYYSVFSSKERKPKTAKHSNNKPDISAVDELLAKHKPTLYNSQYKIAFSEQHSSKASVQKLCYSIFYSTSKYEESWKADLCTKDASQLQPMVDEICPLTTSGQGGKITILKKYVQWCLDNNVPGACDGMLNIQGVVNSKAIYETVTSPRHLQLYLDQVFLPEDLNTVDNVRRTFCWLAYAGMTGEDIFKLKKSDVDLQNNVVHYNGRDYPIYKEAAYSIRCSKEAEVLFLVRSNYSKPVQVYRYESEYLMRGVQCNLSYRAVIEVLSKKQRESIKAGRTKLKLDYFKIWMSGLFYRMYMDELIGIPPDFIGKIDEIAAAKKVTISSNQKRYLYPKYYLSDYNNWKDSLDKRHPLEKPT